MAILNNSNAISSGGYDINNSLRIRGSASAYLNRTPGTAGNRKTWTWSAWIKLGTISVNMGTLFGVQGQTAIYLNDGTNYSFRINGAAGSDLITNLMPRDPAAWYHLVVACDTTQATEANRLKIYVNGVQQTSFQAGSAYPTLNGDTFVNSTALHTIGRRSWNSDQQFDGYIAEQYLIDGSAKAASDFGETDATTGVWKPKAYSGTYGTNGFYQKYSDIATTSGSNAGLGKDFSGNANYFNTNNISVTAGVTYDAMIDSPTLTSATVANYAVLNPLTALTTISISDGNLKTAYASGSASFTNIPSTIYVSSGKWYFEATNVGGNYTMIGVANQSASLSEQYGSPSNTWTYFTSGTKFGNGSGGSGLSYGASYGNNDIIGVALDLDSGTLEFFKNGVSQGVAFNTGLTGQTLTAWMGVYTTGNGCIANFGQRPFAYTPPTGFVRLNTFNLPDSTIKKGNTVMDATLYTGNGSTQTVTNAAGFKPDLVWLKSRAGTYSTSYNLLYDSIRGAGKFLSSNTTGADTGDSGDLLGSFNSNGFSVNNTLLGSSNPSADGSGTTYVGWQWQAGQGSTSSNTSGSITSTVSVNTTAGFSVVTYTGNGTSGATFGHGLGVSPRMVIVKIRNTTDNWRVGHAFINNGSSPWNYNLTLNQTNAQQLNSTVWNNTAPTSTLVTLGNDSSVNASSSTYVAYCWAEIAGFSKFGSWTGNASTDGPFVYTGFRPKFVLFKNSSAVTVWIIFDTARNTYNFVDTQLRPNASDSDNSAGSSFSMDILSNGFKLRSSDSNFNGSGNTIIYAAFAENPFKNANAR
jgi:hypothetical protein